MELLVIGLGSNVGDRRTNLEEAILQLTGFFGHPYQLSTFIETEPWGFETENWFLNGVVVFKVTGNVEVAGVEGVIKVLMKVEQGMGRVRNGQGYVDRIIDLDLLFYGGLVIDRPELTIPHPHLHKRSFVLEPLAEVCPGLVHPVMQKTVLELLEEFKNRK